MSDKPLTLESLRESIKLLEDTLSLEPRPHRIDCGSQECYDYLKQNLPTYTSAFSKTRLSLVSWSLPIYLNHNIPYNEVWVLDAKGIRIWQPTVIPLR